MPATVALEPLATANELAKETGIPPTTWRYWAQSGTGPQAVKLGGRWFWKRSVVAAWIDAQETSH